MPIATAVVAGLVMVVLLIASTKILLAEVPATDDVWSAAGTAALLLARADAGILDSDEVEPVRDAVTKIVGQAKLDRLAQIWRQAHTTDDFDTDTMVELGRRWCAVLGIKPDDTSIPPLGAPSGPAGGSGTSGSGPAAAPPATAAYARPPGRSW